LASFLELLLKVTRSPSIPLTVRKKLLRTRSIARGRSFRARIFEGIYHGITGSHLDDKVFLYGLHEAATIRLMRTILATDRRAGRRTVLVDIGTNTGLHVLGCAALADDVFGFEPWAPVREAARRNLEESGFRNVRLFDFGLSDADARLPFAPPSGTNLGVGSFAAAADGGGVELEVRRGDDVLAAEAIAPTLIKIDTEGFERRVLAGLGDTLARHRPAVVFEWNEHSRSDLPDASTVAGVFPAGYRVYGIARSRETPRLVPFRGRGRFENLLAWPDATSLPV
jgi:FkbM family methyltransferase